MKKLILITGFLALCFVTKAQSNPENLAQTNKSAASAKDIDTSFVPDKITTTVEQMPYYPGGPKEMQKFINENLRYPKAARENGIQGKVITKFIIDKEGNLTDAQVVRGIGGGCDEEALRLLNAMPKWKPGKLNGEPVKVYYTLPLTFKAD